MKQNDGDLQRDGVRRKFVGADPSHEERGGVEDRHLEGEGQADRQADAPEGAIARPIGAPERARRGGSAASLPVEARPPTARPANMKVLDTVVAMPAPTRPSAGKPSLPNISTQAAATFDGKRQKSDHQRPSQGARGPPGTSAGRGRTGTGRRLHLQRADVVARRPRELRLLADGEEDRARRSRRRSRSGRRCVTAAHRPCRTVRRTSRTECRRRPSSSAMRGEVGADEPDAEDQEREVEVGPERARRRAPPDRASPSG